MLSHSLNAILVLCLLTLSYCSATRGIPPIGRLSSSGEEISILEATCYNRKYDSRTLDQAAKSAKKVLDNLEESNLDIAGIVYSPSPEEEMPFSPPYFFHVLYHDTTNDVTTDYAIVTRNGRLAKVATQVRWQFRLVNCQMRYAEPSPAATSYFMENKWRK